MHCGVYEFIIPQAFSSTFAVFVHYSLGPSGYKICRLRGAYI